MTANVTIPTRFWLEHNEFRQSNKYAYLKYDQACEAKTTSIPLDRWLARVGVSGPGLLIAELASQLPDGAIIAGSSVISLIDSSVPHNDIDIYFSSVSGFDELANSIRTGSVQPQSKFYGATLLGTEASPKFETMAIGSIQTWRTPVVSIHMPVLGKNIQLITMTEFKSQSHVIDTFDFTCCKASVSNSSVCCDKFTVTDVHNRKLAIDLGAHLHGTVESLVKRIAKYVEKGFRPDPSVYHAMDKRVLESVVIDNGEIVLAKSPY